MDNVSAAFFMGILIGHVVARALYIVKAEVNIPKRKRGHVTDCPGCGAFIIIEEKQKREDD